MTAPRTAVALKEHAAKRLRLRQAYGKHHHGFHHEVDFWRHTHRIDRVGQRLDDERPDHAAPQAELAARQGGTAQRDGQDGVKLQQQPGVVAVRALDVGADDEPRNTGHGAAECVDAKQQRLGVEPRKTRGHGVDADGLDKQTQRRAVHQQQQQAQHSSRDVQPKRQPEQIAIAHEEERLVVHGDDLAAGNELRHAAAGHHQDQRGDDGLHARTRHQQAIPQAAHQRCAHRSQQRQQQWGLGHIHGQAVLHDQRAADKRCRNGAGNGDHRAH